MAAFSSTPLLHVLFIIHGSVFPFCMLRPPFQALSRFFFWLILSCASLKFPLASGLPSHRHRRFQLSSHVHSGSGLARSASTPRFLGIVWFVFGTQVPPLIHSFFTPPGRPHSFRYFHTTFLNPSFFLLGSRLQHACTGRQVILAGRDDFASCVEGLGALSTICSSLVEGCSSTFSSAGPPLLLPTHRLSHGSRRLPPSSVSFANSLRLLRPSRSSTPASSLGPLVGRRFLWFPR